jgi:type IV pilus assembly protein PilB
VRLRGLSSAAHHVEPPRIQVEQHLPPDRRRLGDVLIERNLLTKQQLDDALSAQRVLVGGSRRRLGQLIVEMGFLTERQLAEALADLLSLELVDSADLIVPMDVARLLPRQVAERARVLVLGKNGDSLRIATADPTNVVALDDVRAYTKSQSLSLVVATESMIREHIARIYTLSDEGDAFDLQPDETEADEAEAAMLLRAADQAPTVKLVNQLLSDGVRVGASDIHIEPQSDGVYVRHRIDGVLRDVTRVPKAMVPALISRLKIVASMDIAERRVPQDGRMKVTANGISVDARVSSLPSMHGEKIVIRLLPEARQITPVTAMGMEPEHLAQLLQAAEGSQGLILITGPTGSGKTNTLYSLLNGVSTREKNVVTLEDPVEIQLPGITQVQTNERAGLTFARGLRSILRQDPDVLLVGEVRDAETAALALEASLTGHLVLTTLHTKNAAAAVTRLVDMGAEPYLVASSLTLVVAQRLVRRPCKNCAAPYQPDPKLLRRLGVTAAELAKGTPLMGVGCTECNGSGYRGRVGIFEVLIISENIRDVLLSSPTERAVALAADAEGMRTMRDAALRKAFAGETTFEEVLRVTDDPVNRHERRHSGQVDELAQVIEAAILASPMASFVPDAEVVVEAAAPVDGLSEPPRDRPRVHSDATPVSDPAPVSDAVPPVPMMPEAAAVDAKPVRKRVASKPAAELPPTPFVTLAPEPTVTTAAKTAPKRTAPSVDVAAVAKPAVAKAPVSRAPVSRVPVAKVPATKAPVTKAPVTKAVLTTAPVSVTPPVAKPASKRQATSEVAVEPVTPVNGSKPVRERRAVPRTTVSAER